MWFWRTYSASRLLFGLCSLVFSCIYFLVCRLRVYWPISLQCRLSDSPLFLCLGCSPSSRVLREFGFYSVCRWAWGLRNKSSSPSFRSHLVCVFRISDRYVVMFCAGISSEEAVEIPLLWSFAYSAAVAFVVSKADVCQL